MGYSARQAGMAVSSGGLVLMFLFPVAGALAPRFDPRKLVAMRFRHHHLRSLAHDVDQSQHQLRNGCQLARRHRARTAVPVHSHQHALLLPAFPRRNTTKSADSPRSCAISAVASASASSPLCLLASARSISPCSLPKAAAGNPAYERCTPAWPAHGRSVASAMPDAIYHAGAQIYGMAQSRRALLAYVDVIWVMVAVTACLVPDAVPDEPPPRSSPPHPSATKRARAWVFR